MLAACSVPFAGVASGPSWKDTGGRGRRTSARPREKDTSGEIVLTSRVGRHSQQLFKAAIDGQPMTVEIVIVGGGGSVKLELKGALVASYSSGGGGREEFESWTLNFTSMEQSGQEDAEE